MSMTVKVSVRVGQDVVEVPVVSKEVVQNAKRNGTVMEVLLDGEVLKTVTNPEKIAVDKEAVAEAAKVAETARKAKLDAENQDGHVNEVKAKAARNAASERVERDKKLREKNAENTKKAAQK